ncbi:hypothetical protein DL89DRAFT_292007 [Linderina pennispora]|uniref:Cytochrome c oxidase subunit VIIc n=1 Tax=Linderina pennispora TaxID=61395 RepID=A0A1Y1WDX6_9FUNG|nr:uncharacterized protein DL89DRAFT_292007 [Linderina pennispora]ORX71528.1 hypothetical protein DL89DRAFT_292007 [Linderina pennispora]
MISAVARTSMRSRAVARVARSDHFHSPNGMKGGFKFLYWGSCAFFSSLPCIAAWWQLRKGNGNTEY